MMRLMELVHGFTGSWGLAIITLTLIVRLLLHPLTQKQMASIRRCRNSSRASNASGKYKDDKILNREMMALYRKTRSTPLPGAFLSLSSSPCSSFSTRC